jgi:phenylacetate-CoA ligase
MRVRGSIFRLAHELAYPGFTEHYRMLLKNQWKDYPSLKKEQDEALKALVRHSYDNVPYYHRLFRDMSLRPEDIRTVEDLQKLPILTKATIKANWDQFTPANLSKIKHVSKGTGGSTGTPLVYRMSKNDLMMCMCQQVRGWSYLGYEFGDAMVQMGGTSLTLGIKNSAMKRAHELVRHVRILSSFDMTEKGMHEYVSIMNRFKPEFVFGYSTSLYFLSQWLLKKEIGVHRPEAVFTTAERLFPKARKSIEEAFDCGVFDSYGVNDGGVSAAECDRREGLHINTERSIMEVVADDMHQVSKGDGLILATSLHNYAFPFIRYDTGDYATITDENCSCGRGYRLLKEIRGREQEMLVTPEGKYIHGEFFTHIFWEVPDVKEFQVVQDRKDHLEIKIVAEPGFDPKQLDKIKAYIAARSKGWVVEFKQVDRINRAASGKFRFVTREIDL